MSEKNDLLKLVDWWQDPNPPLVVEKVSTMKGHVRVVRDDLLGGGSKMRFIDAMIQSDEAQEFVFGGCPATGYAQISLPIVCKRYNKKATLFMAKRNMNKLHLYQQRGIAEGANYVWVPDGMLAVTLARAREYAQADPTRRLLQLGLEHPTVLASIVKVAQTLPYEPEEIWSVGSSGTLSRGLQLAFPKAKVFIVEVGHVLTDREKGRGHVFRSLYAFDKSVKVSEIPPFPSAPTYDAKMWPFVYEKAANNALVWNVGA